MASDVSAPPRTYRPNLVAAEGEFEQRFVADAVEIEDHDIYTSIAFGSNDPVHILVLTLPPAGAGSHGERFVNVEFNEQGNDTDHIESIELGSDYFRVTFKGTLQAGRVTFKDDTLEDERPDEDDERFSHVERFDDVAVSSICVRFHIDANQFAILTGQLTRCLDLFELTVMGPFSGPFSEPQEPPSADPDESEPEEPLELTVNLDADVLDGFCYGQPWARNLTPAAKLRVLEAIRDLYIETVRVPPGIVLDWCLRPERRMAGPTLDVDFEPVTEALERAGEELRFGDAAESVLPRLRAAAGAG